MQCGNNLPVAISFFNLHVFKKNKMLKGERCIYFSCYCSNAENNHAFQNSNSNKNNKFKLNRGFLIVLERKAGQYQMEFYS